MASTPLIYSATDATFATRQLTFGGVGKPGLGGLTNEYEVRSVSQPIFGYRSCISVNLDVCATSTSGDYLFATYNFGCSVGREPNRQQTKERTDPPPQRSAKVSGPKIF
jgi:hypothetical protein